MVGSTGLDFVFLFFVGRDVEGKEDDTAGVGESEVEERAEAEVDEMP